MTSVGKQWIVTLGAAALAVFGAVAPASANTVCDLRADLPLNAPTCGIGSGLFATDEQHPTGTGYIDSFLRIQQNGWEQGYNTSGRPVQYNEKTDPNFTRDLTLPEVSIKNINGVDYREFFLDVNESATTNNNKGYITLDQLEIFVSNTASLTTMSRPGQNDGSGTLAGANKIYDMDNATNDNYVQLNYNLSGSGSGSSDMVFYLPNALFGNYKYVYLYSEFGKIDTYGTKYASDAGFEEWFTKSSIPPPNTAVPEPASLALLGTGLLAAWRRRKMSASR